MAMAAGSVNKVIDRDLIDRLGHWELKGVCFRPKFSHSHKKYGHDLPSLTETDVVLGVFIMSLVVSKPNRWLDHHSTTHAIWSNW